MKERGILFQTPMVRSIHKGIKTMTRRTNGLEEMNEAPEKWKPYVGDFYIDKKGRLCQKFQKGIRSEYAVCPYGNVGDILWVRETYFQTETSFIYKSDLSSDEINKFHYIGNKWQPSRFMPKNAARIWLEIEEITVARLQEIWGDDAIMEGIEPLAMSAAQIEEFGQLYFDYSKPKQFFNEGLFPFWSFCSLWCTINGNDSWELNPWVWVIKFEVLSVSGRPEKLNQPFNQLNEAKNSHYNKAKYQPA